MRRKIITILFFVLVANGCFAQDQITNLNKYWTYRNRFREKFIAVSQNVEHYGVNIPASLINWDNDVIEWGDANNSMSHYLSVLATELWLLKNNNQDYSQTLKELYYAMLAMERMDQYSEYSLRYKYNIGYSVAGIWVRGFVNTIPDRNGFHIRDDVSTGFWASYKNHFPVNNFSSIFVGDDEHPSMEESSQDNIYHNLEGLALISKLVGEESVAGIPVTFINSYTPTYLADKQIQNGNTVNFSTWAKDFTKRYVNYIQKTGTATFTIPLIGTFETHWILLNPVTWEFVREGSGKEGETDLFYQVGLIAAGDKITGESLRVYNSGFTDQNSAINRFKSLFELGPLVFDDYKVRTLGMIGDIEGANTWSLLRVNRDRGTPFIYEHLPLYYTILHDDNRALMPPESAIYNQDRSIIETLLNLAPVTGPRSNGNLQWSSDSRLVWPEKLGEKALENIEYSGLDYMLEHNLYYMAFRKEDFINIKIIPVVPLINSIFGNGTFRYGTIEAQNQIPANGNASYYASKSITLLPGFVAPLGARFTAKAEPRANNYQGNLYAAPGSSTGRIGSDSEWNSGMENEVYNSSPYDGPFTRRIEKGSYSAVSEESLEVTIAPNPVSQYMSVKLNQELQGTGKLVLSETSGRTVMEKEIVDNEYSVNLGALNNGVYVARFYFNGKMVSRKVVVFH